MDDFQRAMAMMSGGVAPMDMASDDARQQANAAWDAMQQQQPQATAAPAGPSQAPTIGRRACAEIMRRVLTRWQQKREEDLALTNPDELECIRFSRAKFLQQYGAGQLEADNDQPGPRILNLQEPRKDPNRVPKPRVLRLWQVVAARRLLFRALGSGPWRQDPETKLPTTPNASLLAVHDVGLGKTITAIMVMAGIYKKIPNPAKNKILIAVPKSVLNIWYKTLQSWTTIGGRVFLLTKQSDINGVKLTEEERLPVKRFDNAHVVLTTPDTIKEAFKTYMEDTQAKFGNRRTQPRSETLAHKRNERLRHEPVHHFFQTFYDNPLSLLVIDEVHAYKGRNTWWGIVLHDLAKHAYCKLGLTGTPVTNKPEDFADLAKVLNVQDQSLHDPDAYRIKDTNDLKREGVEAFQTKYMDRADVSFAEEELPQRAYVALRYDPFVGLLPDGTMNLDAVRAHNETLARLHSILRETKHKIKLGDLDLADPDAPTAPTDEDGSGDSSVAAARAAAAQSSEMKAKNKTVSTVMGLQKKIEQAEFSPVLAKYGATAFTQAKPPRLRQLLQEAADDAPSEAMMLIARVIRDRQAAGYKRIAVFCQLTAVHLILQRFLEGRDVGQIFLFDSSVGDARKRGDLIRDFKECPKGVLLFTEAGGVGITLSPECAVMLSVGPLSWSPATVDQAFGRVYRIGAEQPVEIIQFVARRSLTALKMHLHDDKRLRLGKALMDKDYSNFAGANDDTWKYEKNPLASLRPLDEEGGNYLVLERQVNAMRTYQEEMAKHEAGARAEAPEMPVDWPRAPVLPSRMPLPPVSFHLN